MGEFPPECEIVSAPGPWKQTESRTMLLLGEEEVVYEIVFKFTVSKVTNLVYKIELTRRQHTRVESILLLRYLLRVLPERAKKSEHLSSSAHL